MDLTHEQLLAHQATIRARQPNLPSAARRAFKQAKTDPDRWRAILAAHQHGKVSPPDRRGRRLKVSVLARPDIDIRRIAQALIHDAQDRAQQDADAKDSTA